MVSLDSVVVRKDGILEATLHDELVLLSIEKDSYFGLTETSRIIWERLAAPVCVSSLCEELARLYNAPPSIVQKDTLDFLTYMEKRALVLVGN